jgi:hypothetical protein
LGKGTVADNEKLTWNEGDNFETSEETVLRLARLAAERHLPLSTTV